MERGLTPNEKLYIVPQLNSREIVATTGLKNSLRNMMLLGILCWPSMLNYEGPCSITSALSPYVTSELAVHRNINKA